MFTSAEPQSASLLSKSTTNAKSSNWTRVFVLMAILTACGVIGYIYCNPMIETPSTHRFIQEADINMPSEDNLDADWGPCTACTYRCCTYSADCPYNWGKGGNCDMRATPKMPKTPKPTNSPGAKGGKGGKGKGGKKGKKGKKKGGKGGEDEDEYYYYYYDEEEEEEEKR